MRVAVLSFLTSVLFFIAAPVFGAGTTYYIDTIGSDSTGDGSLGNPYHSSTHAVLTNGGENIYIYVAGSTTTPKEYTTIIDNPTSGTTSYYTILKSTVMGGVLLNGDNQRSCITIGNSSSTRSYITVENFIAYNSSDSYAVQTNSPDGTAEGSETNNIILNNIIAWGEQNNGGAAIGWFRTTKSTGTNLTAFGGGRYIFQTFGVSSLYFKNVLARWDYWMQLDHCSSPSVKCGDPKFAVGIYNSTGIVFDQLYVVDRATTPSAADSGTQGGLYLPSNTTPLVSNSSHTSFNTFNNTLILNTARGKGLVIEDWIGGPGNSNNTFNDLVIWDAQQQGISIQRNCDNNSFTNVTVSSTGWGTTNNASITEGASGTFPIINAQIINNYSDSGDGVSGSGWDNSYLNVFNIPGSDYSGASADATDISSSAVFVYITTVSSTTAGSGLGESGSDIGADLTFAYDEGVLTSEYAWPWPNEDLIYRWSCDEFVDQNSNPRTDGYCQNTLGDFPITRYAWEYLGNSCPEEICGAAAVDTSSPTAPGTPTVTSTGTATLDWSWSAATDDTAVTDYRVDLSTDSGFGSYIGSYQDYSNSTNTTLQTTGLSEGTTYYMRVRAKDAAGNTGSNSSTGQGTTSVTVTPSSVSGITGSGTITGSFSITY